MREPSPSVIEDFSRRYPQAPDRASGRDYSAGEIDRMTEPIARPVRGGRAGLEPATNGLPTGLTAARATYDSPFIGSGHRRRRVTDPRVYTAGWLKRGANGVIAPTRGAPRRPWRRCWPTTCADDYRACARSCCVEASHTGAMRQLVLFAVLGDVKVCGRGHFTAGMNAPSVVSSVAAIDGKLRTALIRSSRAQNSLPIATGRPRSSSSPTGA